MRLLVVISIALAISAHAEDQSDHEASALDMQGLRLRCDTESKLEFVRQFEGVSGFDFLRLTRLPEVPVDVFVDARELPAFEAELKDRHIEYEVVVRNLTQAIEKELAQQTAALAAHLETDDIFGAFPTYAQIKNYLQGLAKSHSDIVTYFSIGKSYEGRDIVGVKISSGGKDKPVLFIDAGIHAREWAAPITALYAIDQLAKNKTNSHVFKNVDIYVVPSLNPDGYEYTHKNKQTRMWRKTRSVHGPSTCIGVDANRNFEFKWMTVGASSDPCSDTYAGPKPFSEPETAALKKFMLSLNDIRVYLTFHSYGNYLLHPWGYTSALPANEPTLRSVAEKAEAALSKIRGTRYTIGSSTRVLYPAAGGSDDWAKALANAELAYTVELPSAEFGFAPPPSEILPIGIETFEAIKVFAEYAAAEVD